MATAEEAIGKHAMEMLEGNGIQPTEENAMQLIVFLQALRTYDSRTSAYGQVWKQYGALSNLLSVARKTDRIMSSWWHEEGEKPVLHKDNLDDAIDLLNYTAFFIRNAREGNLTGEQPERLSVH